MTEQQDGGIATRAVHAGQEADAATGAITPPIHQTSTYVQDGVGGLRGGYEYGRSGNPTRAAFERQIAALEYGTRAIAFASGLAAEDGLLRAVLAPGQRVIVGNDVYGGTYRLLTRVLGPWGIGVDVVDMSDLDAVRASLSAATAHLLWVETPSNPLMKITDIAALAEVGHASGAKVVVDNTFASPALQQPLTLGADFVVHSATKYLGGHSDALGGVVVTADQEAAERVAFLQFAAGGILAPMEAWLITRGVKTLPIRMAQHSANAAVLVDALAGHPAVSRVLYPGLPEHPGHAIAAKQMSGFGGMFSIRLAGGPAAARRLVESVRLFSLAESLGGVESLIGYPSEMTHASVKGTPLAVPEDLVRVSVGIEDVADLRADLEQALAAL